MKLVECVPNFSEGQNQEVIDGIAKSIASVEGVKLLDVDPGRDTNRTVFTFIGEPSAVLEAAFASIQTAQFLIDMREHRGTHARLGACDVCPLVPVQEVSMKECVELAKTLGQRVGEELGIPVYLYEEAATRKERKNLATIRRGEYEGLAQKLQDPVWMPDFGPAQFNPKSGATVIGAREFLIAFNFNLNTRDEKKAQRIAEEIREIGQKGRPGKFKHVKAVGWYLEEFQRAQVSMNLTNHKQTSLAQVFEEVCQQAQSMGMRCTGSELVGLIPKDCLLEVGRYFFRKAGKGAGMPEAELLRMAVVTLGLSDLYPFKEKEKILELCLQEQRPLVDMSVQAFVDETSRDSPVPGGGSVSALCGALAASLASMVSHLTIGKKGYESSWEKMKELGEQAQVLKDFFLRCVDDDTMAYRSVLTAFRLPKKTEEQKLLRKQAIQKATLKAIEVPLSALRSVEKLMLLLEEALQHGNRNSRSDAAVGLYAAQAAAQGAHANVGINLPGLENQKLAQQYAKEADRILKRVQEQVTKCSPSSW